MPISRILPGNTIVQNTLSAGGKLSSGGINKPTIGGYGVVNKNIGWVGTTNGSAGNYWHMRTNSQVGSTVDMIELSAYGYAYGNSSIVNISWGWHTDGGNGNIYSKAYRSQSTGGVTANNIYQASNGDVVCVAYVPSTYFTSMFFDAHLAQHYATYDFQITAHTFTSSNSGAY